MGHALDIVVDQVKQKIEVYGLSLARISYCAFFGLCKKVVERGSIFLVLGPI